MSLSCYTSASKTSVPVRIEPKALFFSYHGQGCISSEMATTIDDQS